MAFTIVEASPLVVVGKLADRNIDIRCYDRSTSPGRKQNVLLGRPYCRPGVTSSVRRRSDVIAYLGSSRQQEHLDDKRIGEKRISDVRRRLECGQPIIHF